MIIDVVWGCLGMFGEVQCSAGSGSNMKTYENNMKTKKMYLDYLEIWLQVKMRGPDQPPKPTGDPDPRSRPAIQTVPDPFQTSSMESKGSTAMLPRRQNRSVRPVQNHLIQFKSYMK